MKYPENLIISLDFWKMKIEHQYMIDYRNLTEIGLFYGLKFEIWALEYFWKINKNFQPF